MKYNQPVEAIKTEYDLNIPEGKKALEDIKDKRAYAEQKDEESFDALIESREELIKSMKP